MSLAPPLAVERSKVEAELVALPFPTWYRQAAVKGLAQVLRRARRCNGK
jgi:hypothetical protein